MIEVNLAVNERIGWFMAIDTLCFEDGKEIFRHLIKAAPLEYPAALLSCIYANYNISPLEK